MKAHVEQLQAAIGLLQVHAEEDIQLSPALQATLNVAWIEMELCLICGRQGHFAQFCPSRLSPTGRCINEDKRSTKPKSYCRKKGKSAERNIKSMEAVADDFATLTIKVLEISGISTENNVAAQVQFNLDDRRVAHLSGKVDTGARGYIRLFRQMFHERIDKTGRRCDGMLKPSSIILKAHCGTNNFKPRRVRHCLLSRGQAVCCETFLTDTNRPAFLTLRRTSTTSQVPGRNSLPTKQLCWPSFKLFRLYRRDEEHFASRWTPK